MGVGIETPPRLLTALTTRNLNVLLTRVTMLTIAQASGKQFFHDADHILQNQLRSIIVYIIGLLLDQHRAGGVLGEYNNNTVAQPRCLELLRYLHLPDAYIA